MIKHRYDIHLEAGDDASLVLVKFPAMQSQFANPADQIHLSIKPKSYKIKLDVANRNFYTSTQAAIEDGQLYACKISNGKLICRPVCSLLTMRSDFSHLDLKEENSDPREEVRPVSVRFAAPERPSSTAKSRNQEADDPTDEYKPLNFANLASRDSAQRRQALFGGMARVKPDPDAEFEDRKPFLDSVTDIKPKIEAVHNSDSPAPQSSPRKNIAIRQRVRDCLLRAKLVSFDEVHQFVKDMDGLSDQMKPTNKDLLDALTDMAVLVQGNWAAKSEVLYGDSSERDSTDVTGISINLFIAARDYLLWLFNQDRLVSRPEFSKKVRIPDHDALELFEQLATFKEDSRKWELMLPTDHGFLDKFPEVVQRQATFWKVRRANKLSMFG